VRPVAADAQALWLPDMASANEAGQAEASMVGQPGPPMAGCTIQPDEGSQ
jgi:hypothetical protein